jgi:hypothetical protein
MKKRFFSVLALIAAFVGVVYANWAINFTGATDTPERVFITFMGTMLVILVLILLGSFICQAVDYIKGDK